MSIIDSFDNVSEEILKPSCVTAPIENLPEVVVVTFNENVINLVRNMYGAVQISEMNACFTIPKYKMDYKGKDIAVETRKNMVDRKSEGCLTVDMECASIMSVSQFRNVELYQYLYGEDTLDGVEWDSRTMGRVQISSFEEYLQTALEIAVRV